MAVRDEFIDILIEQIIEEWTAAGHNVTGNFIESLRGEWVEEDDKWQLRIWGNDYGLIKNSGVPAANIPYKRKNRGQGSGGQSKYITGIKNWVMLRLGIGDERKALGVAFAIANKHSERGIPGSGFLDTVLEKNMQTINELSKKTLNEELRDSIKLNKK